MMSKPSRGFALATGLINNDDPYPDKVRDSISPMNNFYPKEQSMITIKDLVNPKVCDALESLPSDIILDEEFYYVNIAGKYRLMMNQLHFIFCSASECEYDYEECIEDTWNLPAHKAWVDTTLTILNHLGIKPYDWDKYHSTLMRMMKASQGDPITYKLFNAATNRSVFMASLPISTYHVETLKPFSEHDQESDV